MEKAAIGREASEERTARVRRGSGDGMLSGTGGAVYGGRRELVDSWDET